jgi:hypothetical protein
MISQVALLMWHTHAVDRRHRKAVRYINITYGFLFPAIGRWGGVKRLVARAGLDPAVYSGHSLRSGPATSATERATERAIMDQPRHRSLKQGRKYIRRGPGPPVGNRKAVAPYEE